MPELPEVEILARHLNRVLRGSTILRTGPVHPRMAPEEELKTFAQVLDGRRIASVSRRAKYLLFDLLDSNRSRSGRLIAHLGMTGRIYLAPNETPLPKHTVFSAALDRGVLIFEDARRFGRLSLSESILETLGLEPLDASFTPDRLESALKGTRQPVKTALLDQKRLVGVGNIYASEALFEAGIHPATPCNALRLEQLNRLHSCIRAVLQRAIELGASLDLAMGQKDGGNGLFYFGAAGESAGVEEIERFKVYDRAGEPCPVCRSEIKRIVIGARSSFYCPSCQPAREKH